MNLKLAIIPVLLVSLFMAAPAASQPANNTTSMDNVSILASIAALHNETVPGNATAAGNGTAPANATAPVEQPKIKGMWSITGIESGPIAMALNQEGEEVFGQAKYEPDSGQAWNAEVVGSFFGDKAELTLSALKGKESVTTRMSGVFANESIIGSFSQVSGGKIVNKGNFTATWFSEDTSRYAPAVIEQPKAETQQTASDATSSIPNSVEITSSSFQPNSITVQMGTTVTWINHDTKEQVVVATSGEFDSGNIVAGGQYQYTFSKAGTFDYYSKISPSMTGKIIVAGSSKSRFVDVRQYADKIGPGGDLSGIPPGMGGAAGTSSF